MFAYNYTASLLSGFHVIKRNIIFDKLDSEWEVEFAEVIGLSTVKKNVIVIPVLTADGVSNFSH